MYKRQVPVVSDLADVSDTSGGNRDLTPTNHHAILFWTKRTVVIGVPPMILDGLVITKVPSKRNDKAMLHTIYAGGTRVFNKEVFVLLIKNQ